MKCKKYGQMLQIMKRFMKITLILFQRKGNFSKLNIVKKYWKQEKIKKIMKNILNNMINQELFNKKMIL